jgi:Transcription elongation factor, N-terminal
MNRFPITAAGHAALQGELKHRIRVERPRLILRVKEAIADNWLSIRNTKLPRQTKSSMRPVLLNLKTSSCVPK